MRAGAQSGTHPLRQQHLTHTNHGTIRALRGPPLPVGLIRRLPGPRQTSCAGVRPLRRTHAPTPESPHPSEPRLHRGGEAIELAGRAEHTHAQRDDRSGEGDRHRVAQRPDLTRRGSPQRHRLPYQDGQRALWTAQTDWTMAIWTARGGSQYRGGRSAPASSGRPAQCVRDSLPGVLSARSRRPGGCMPFWPYCGPRPAENVGV